MSLSLAIIVALVPLIMAPNLFLYFETIPKAAVILIAGGVLLWNLGKFEASVSRLSESGLGLLLILGFAAQTVSLAVSSYISQDRMLSLLGTGWRRFGSIEQVAILLLSVLIAAWYAQNSDGLVILFRTICLSGMIISAYGIVQYLGWDPFADAARYSVSYGDLSIVRPPSTLGHALYLGNYLVILIFVSGALASWGNSRFDRSLAFVSAVLASVALLLTGSRSAIAGLVVGGIFLIVRIRPALTNKRIVIAGVLAAILGALYLSPLGQQIDDRWVQWRDDAKGGTRPLLWRDSLQMAREHLVLGTGPEMFAAEFPKYQSVELARAFPEYYHESAHNFLLEALLAQGLPGLMICLVLTSVGIAASFQWTHHRAPAACLAAGLAGLFVSQLFSPFVLTNALFFYLTIAILVAGSVPASSGGNIVVKILGVAAIPLGALFVVAGLAFLNVDLRWAAIQQSLRAGHVDDAMGEYRSVASMFPPESGADLWYSRALADAASRASDGTLRQRVWTQSLDAATRATQVSEDRHNAFYNLAVFYSTQGDLAHSEQALSSAIQCAPNWYKPHWLLAEVELLSGKLDPAAREAQKAIDLNGQNRWELRDTLQRIRVKQGLAANTF